MAICDLCSQEMKTAPSCTVGVLHQAGTAFPLLRYGQERGWKRGPARCGDCGVRRGGLHHLGCDVQRCPRCLGQLISCDCSFDERPLDDLDDDDSDDGAFEVATLDRVAPVLTISSSAAPVPARPFVPLGDAAAPARARHREALRRVGEWSLAHGRACDLDVAALCLDALECYRSSTGIRLDRPTVNGVLYADVRNSGSSLRTTLPEHWHIHLWTVVCWAHDDGGLSPESDPLPALLEPLRCYGGLGEDGHPMPEGTDVDFPCQCCLPYDPSCPPGLVQHIVGRDLESWQDFVVRAHIRPRSEDPVLSSYRPLFAIARRLRETDSPFQVHADEFIYVGRIDAERSTPELWLYCYSPTRRRGFEDLVLDSDGQAWAPRADGRRVAGFRWVRIGGHAAAYRCGIAAATFAS